MELYSWSNFASKNIFYNTWVNNFGMPQKVFITCVKIKIYSVDA